MKEKLGQGAFGEVRIGTTPNNFPVAIKKIAKHSLSHEKYVSQLQVELKSMYKLSHPNIVRLYDHIEDAENIYFVMEYCEKNSLLTLTKRRKQSESSVKQIIFQILKGLEFIHSQQMIHRDLKLENVLLDREQNVKISDFGWSALLDNEKRTTFCGTYEYLAPEFFQNLPYDNKVDVWATGVIMFELTNGRVPFQRKNMIETQNAILKDRLKFDTGISMALRDIISKCLNKHPSRRPTVQQLLESDYFSNMDPIQYTVQPDDFNYMTFVFDQDFYSLKEYPIIQSDYKDIAHSISQQTGKIMNEIEREYKKKDTNKLKDIPEESEYSDIKGTLDKLNSMGSDWVEKYKSYKELLEYGSSIDFLIEENKFYQNKINEIETKSDKLVVVGEKDKQKSGLGLDFAKGEIKENFDGYISSWNEYIGLLVEYKILCAEEEMYSDINLNQVQTKMNHIVDNFKKI